jgi:hypothetical protein
MSQVFGDLKNFLKDALKEAEGKVFNIEELKGILNEFNLIDDRFKISKLEQLIDVRMNFGEPDLVFSPIVTVPVMVVIHKDKAIYEIVSLMPNPNQNSEKPYVYAIQAGMLYDKDKSDLHRINATIKSWRQQCLKNSKVN